MSMDYSDIATVDRDLDYFGLNTEGEEEVRRERLAHYFETYDDGRGDKLAAWEVRTGKPWAEMTKEEAKRFVETNPEMMRNPGVLSRLLGD